MKDVIAKVAFLCLNRFFEVFLNYRIAFRGENVYNGYKYLYSESPSSIHPVVFLAIRRFIMLVILNVTSNGL